MNPWFNFVDAFARRGGQNLMLFILTLFFAVMVAYKAVPPELTLTPVITGMMAFMRHNDPPASPSDSGKKDGQ